MKKAAVLLFLLSVSSCGGEAHKPPRVIVASSPPIALGLRLTKRRSVVVDSCLQREGKKHPPSTISHVLLCIKLSVSSLTSLSIRFRLIINQVAAALWALKKGCVGWDGRKEHEWHSRKWWLFSSSLTARMKSEALIPQPRGTFFLFIYSASFRLGKEEDMFRTCSLFNVLT